MIVQQGGVPIVQQAGYASPIVQNVNAPVVQQSAPEAALVVQQTPTIVQQPNWPQAPSVPAGPIIDQGGRTFSPFLPKSACLTPICSNEFVLMRTELAAIQGQTDLLECETH